MITSIKLIPIFSSLLLTLSIISPRDAEPENAATPAPVQVSSHTIDDSTPTNTQLSNVPLIQQNPELPRGCEVTSLAMLLNYAGVNVDKMELASGIAKVDFDNNGLRGDMREGFVGNMYTFDEPGLGVNAQPVFELGSKYLPDRLINLTGNDISELYKMIDQGSPVWVITNSRFKQLPDEEFLTWQTTNGPMKVTYHEHSVVMTGYDDNYVYLNDPLDTNSGKAVDKHNFEQAWIQMGRQAISYN